MTTSSHFAPGQVVAFTQARILGVRAGRTHRYTGVWVVVVENRVFVRSWGAAPAGWYHALRGAPGEGSVSLGSTEVPIRARHVRSVRLRAAVSAAYAAKYPTPGSAKWVKGFAEPGREATTLELVPR